MKNYNLRQLQQIRSKASRARLLPSPNRPTVVIVAVCFPRVRSQLNGPAHISQAGRQVCTYHVFQFVLHDYRQFNSTLHDLRSDILLGTCCFFPLHSSVCLFVFSPSGHCYSMISIRILFTYNFIRYLNFDFVSAQLFIDVVAVVQIVKHSH